MIRAGILIAIAISLSGCETPDEKEQHDYADQKIRDQHNQKIGCYETYNQCVNRIHFAATFDYGGYLQQHIKNVIDAQCHEGCPNSISTQDELEKWIRSAFAQTSVQGTISQDNTPSSCHENKNGFICNQSGTMPKVSGNYLQLGTIQPLEGIPLEQTQAAWGICGVTPSGQCVAIKVDEDGRVIVSPDQKSDAYTAVYQKGYMMGFKNGSETK